MSGYDPLLTVAIPGSDAVYSSSTTYGEGNTRTGLLVSGYNPGFISDCHISYVLPKYCRTMMVRDLYGKF